MLFWFAAEFSAVDPWNYFLISGCVSEKRNEDLTKLYGHLSINRGPHHATTGNTPARDLFLLHRILSFLAGHDCLVSSKLSLFAWLFIQIITSIVGFVFFKVNEKEQSRDCFQPELSFKIK